MVKSILLLTMGSFVFAHSSPLERPYFWSTGLDESRNTVPFPYYAPPNQGIPLNEIHWDTLADWGLGTQDPWVWRSTVAWAEPTFGNWIARLASHQAPIGITPYFLSVSLENNFYTDFELRFEGGADNVATVTVNGGPVLVTIDNVYFSNFPTEYKITGGWGENHNTLNVDVSNVEGSFNPSGLYIGFVQPVAMYPRPDIIWRDYARGVNDIWYCNGTEYKASGFLQTDADLDWKIVGAGFINADPYMDLLWEKGSSGALRVWFTSPAMEGSSVPHTAQNFGIANGVKGLGDFDADGRTDEIVLHHWPYVRYANLPYVGTPAQIAGTIGAELNVDWRIVGVGQFGNPADRSGFRRDIVWRNISTGQNRIWIVSPSPNLGYTVQYIPSVPASSGWNMCAFTKFDGDEFTDVVWRHVNGDVVVWIMNADFTVRSYVTLPTVYPVPPSSSSPGIAWEIVGPK